jgi:DNA-binding LacI/PurR family transcriptional regulator
MTARQRVQGYQKALQSAGIEPLPELTREAFPSISGGYSAALELLRDEQPEAVFCYNDLMALGVYVAARELDKGIPKDLAVVGFDGIVMSPIIDPPLSTVRIEQYELGQMAGEVVLDILQGNQDDPVVIPFPVKLDVRRSSGATFLRAEDERSMWRSIIS